MFLLFALFLGLAPLVANSVVHREDGVLVNQVLEFFRLARSLNGIAKGGLLILRVAAEDPRTYYNTIETTIPTARARMQQQENNRNLQQDLQHE